MAGRWVAGIEIGGTKLQLGVGRGDGKIVALERLAIDPARQAEGIRRQIAEAFPRLLDAAGIARAVVGAVGFGFGGPVNADRGRVERSYQVDGWDDFPLAEWACEHLGVPSAVLHNDADAAGLAEARFGAGMGRAPLLYVTVGSGIGGAIIIDDRIYRGFGKGAGEIGHLLVPDFRGEGPAYALAELEQVASGWAIARDGQRLADSGQFDAAELGGETGQVTGWMVAEAARRGHPGAAGIIVRAQKALGLALAQAVALVAPRRIVIGGGVSLMGEPWFAAVRRAVDPFVFTPFRAGFDIVPAALGEEVVVHGALALAHDALRQRAS
ncbi:MAG: ROK family protein [Isosphaeraceae bacterium]